MSDSKFKHTLAFISTFITLLAYISGYFSGQEGWWWTGFGIFILYGAIYKMIK